MSIQLWITANLISEDAFYEWGTLVTLLGCLFISIALFSRLRSLEIRVVSDPPVLDVQLVPEQRMQQLRNPFAVKLRHPAEPEPQSQIQEAFLKDGVSFELFSKVKCVVSTYWTVEIQSFHQSYSQCWSRLRRQLLTDSFLVDKSASHREETHLEADTWKLVHCTRPASAAAAACSDELGGGRRDKYPLVLMLTDLNSLQEPQQASSQHIVSMVSLVHLKDELVPCETQIISQYARTELSPPTLLQRLYLSTDDKTSAPSDTHDADALCVVCRGAPITCVLLPCRHACVCWQCRSHMDTCPLCRAPTLSYFQLDTTLDQSTE